MHLAACRLHDRLVRYQTGAGPGKAAIGARLLPKGTRGGFNPLFERGDIGPERRAGAHTACVRRLRQVLQSAATGTSQPGTGQGCWWVKEYIPTLLPPLVRS